MGGVNVSFLIGNHKFPPPRNSETNVSRETMKIIKFWLHTVILNGPARQRGSPSVVEDDEEQ